MPQNPAETSYSQTQRPIAWAVGARALALCAATIVLLAGAATAWPGQIDDAYISLVFSHELAESGRLAWSDGRAVEGYSNLLWVLLGSVAALLQLDGGLVLQILAIVTSLATLVVLLPRSTAPPTMGALLIPVLLAASDSMGWWAGNAMETPAFALCLALGWRALLGMDQTSRGVALLCVSALLRPEGHLHLVAALFVLGSARLRKDLRSIGACFAALSAYHLARIAYFGEVLPLPTMIKGIDGQGVLIGLAQAGLDLLPWLGLLGLGAVGSGLGRRARWLALVPLVIQIAVLAKAGGDWMGHSRLLLPGVVAAIAVWGTHCSRSVSTRTILMLTPLAMLPALVTSPLGSPMHPTLRDFNGLLGALAHPRLDLDTTQMIDLQFVVPRIPAGAMVYAGDVGMLGHLSDLTVRDMVGLTDEDIARSRAFGDEDALSRTMARLSGGPGSALCLRMVGWGDSTAPELPAAQAAAYPYRYELKDRWSAIRWSCRESLSYDPDLGEGRWEKLAERFPAHPWIRWNHALALADNGETKAAVGALQAMSGWGTWGPWRGNEAAALLFSRSNGLLTITEGAWVELGDGTEVVSRTLTADEVLSLVIEVEAEHHPGLLDFGVTGPGCEVNLRHQPPLGRSKVPLAQAECVAGGGPFRASVKNAGDSLVRIRPFIQ